jgi:hypothetical protein
VSERVRSNPAYPPVLARSPQIGASSEKGGAPDHFDVRHCFLSPSEYRRRLIAPPAAPGG